MRTGNYSNCVFCGVTLMCTTKVNISDFLSLAKITYMLQDPLKGITEQTFKTLPEKNPQFTIGGGVSSQRYNCHSPTTTTTTTPTTKQP